LALQRWGEPRETVDVDLTLLTGFGNEERFVEILLGRFEARIEKAAEFALTRRVLLLRAPSGWGWTLRWAICPSKNPPLLAPVSSLFQARRWCVPVPPRILSL